MMDWQPIETAPRGEYLLLFFPAEVEPSDRRRVNLGSMTLIDLYPVSYPRKPTHWMPVPPAPETPT
jgi:hypothetical protein